MAILVFDGHIITDRRTIEWEPTKSKMFYVSLFVYIQDYQDKTLIDIFFSFLFSLIRQLHVFIDIISYLSVHEYGLMAWDTIDDYDLI
jgi:hypothetical protein